MNKEQQIKEITEVMVSYGLKRLGEFTETELQVFLDGGKVLEKRNYENIISDFATAIYNAGYRKVGDGAVILSPEEREEEMKACREERLEFEKEIEKLKAENEKRLKASEDFATKHCRMKCEIAKMRVKEFAINLKKVIHEKDYVQGYAEIGLIEEIDELLKEYEI